jgi:hypothetical protein
VGRNKQATVVEWPRATRKESAMIRRMLVSATLWACVPAFVVGLVGRTGEVNAQCCQTRGDLPSFDSPEQARQYTQLTIQTILLRRTNSLLLVPGEYVMSTGPAGHKMKASVNRNRVVSGWYLTDPAGQTLLRASINGNSAPSDWIDACLAGYFLDLKGCELAWGGKGSGYSDCVARAWDFYFWCLLQAPQQKY